MKSIEQHILGYYDIFLSYATRKKAEQAVVVTAIISFTIHLILIVLKNNGLLSGLPESNLLTNPISAIYTPFPFILLYRFSVTPKVVVYM
jgi:hypothetical protein